MPDSKPAISHGPKLISQGALQSITIQTIQDQLKSMVAADQEDLQGFISQIVSDSAEAAAANDQASLAQLVDQGKVVAEIARVRVVEGAEATFNTVLNVALNLLFNALIKAI